MALITQPPDEEFSFDTIPFRDDILGMGKTYVDRSLGKRPADLDAVKGAIEYVEKAVHDLHGGVVRAFDAHDYSLRAQVEKVNTRIAWLLGIVAIVGAGIVLRVRKTDK